MDLWQAMGVGLVGFCIGLVLVALARLPDSRVIRPLLCLIITVVLWSLGELVATYADDMVQKRIGLVILYTGTIFLPACWWALAVRWAQELKGEAHLTRPLWVRAPVLWAGAMWLVMASNPLHGWFLTPVLGGRNEYGPLWWVMAIPNYALILVAGSLVIQASWRIGRPAVRRQALVLVASSSLALLTNWAYVLGAEISSTGTLLVFAIATAILALGMYRQSLFGVLPAALPVIFEHDPDGLLVVRPGGRLVHCNRRARELLAPVQPGVDRGVDRGVELGVGVRIPEDLPGLLPAAVAQPADGADRGAADAGLRWWLEVLNPGGRVYSYGSDAARSLHVSAHAVRGRGASVVALAIRVGDATQLRQAILNLLVNAREVLQDRGGVIRVSTGTARVNPAVCRGLVLGAERPSGRYAFVRVADDGPGIDREAQERIFEPFVSSKGKHRGIGLSTVLGIARAHRALLQLESAPGKGATFGIYLDVAGVER